MKTEVMHPRFAGDKASTEPGIGRRRFVAGLAAGALAPPVWGQSTFPSQPIKLVVGWPAGGGADVIARTVAPGIAKFLGQPVIIENKAGAGGLLAHAFAAKAPADGYTILLSTTDTHAVAQQLNRHAQFGPRDFVGIASLGTHPLGLVVNPSTKATNLREFIEMAASSKDPITYGSYGVGTAAHVMMEAFAAMAKVRMQHIPFQGSAPMIQALLGKQIVSGFSQIVSQDAYIKSGSLRLLAVANRERLPSHTTVPTFKEQGFALEVGSWAGLVAPAKTPAAVTAKLYEAVQAALGDPAVVDKLVAMGTAMDHLKQAEFDKFILSEYDRWGSYIRDNKITTE
jgi:tripartite-type tricarboxylate transporter receptor subunit TctC